MNNSKFTSEYVQNVEAQHDELEEYLEKFAGMRWQLDNQKLGRFIMNWFVLGADSISVYGANADDYADDCILISINYAELCDSELYASMLAGIAFLKEQAELNALEVKQRKIESDRLKRFRQYERLKAEFEGELKEG